MHDEERKDLIVALKRRRQRVRLVVSIEHHADEKEKRELKEDDEAAQDERLLTVTLVAASEQALHKQLIRAVRGHRQKSSANQSGPKSERHIPIESERDELELASRRPLR